MAPHMENQKQCSSKNEKIDNDLLEKLRLEEEREKKKLEKEVKRRAELEKFKNESLERQASLLVPVKKEKQTAQSKNIGLKPQSKKSANKKQQSQVSQSKTNHNSSSQAKIPASKPKSTVSVPQQPYYEARVRHYSTSSESSWKRDGYGKSRSSSRSDSMWGDVSNHFPMLGEAPPPQTNVWVERKIKQEENEALVPQSQYDEEAMLQRALALSMMEASKEQELQQRLEEECRLQMAVLECNPKILEELDVPEEFIVAEEPDHRYQNNLKSEENYPEKSCSTSRALPGFNQKRNSSNIGGARPKLNKVIDSFGGWGLKTAPKDKYDSQLSNFVDEIVSEEPTKKTNNYSSRYQQNTSHNNVKKSDIEDPWDVSDTEAEKPGIPDLWHYNEKSENKEASVLDPWRREVLYDEKGTFTDVEEAKCDFTSSASDYNNVVSTVPELLDEESPSYKLDKWLDSVDESAPVSNGWDDEDVNDKKAPNIIPPETREGDFPDDIGSFSTNNPDTKIENSSITLSSFDTFNSTKKNISENSSYRLNNNFHASSRTAESPKDTLSDMQRCRMQNEFSENNVLTQFQSTYDYIIGSDTKTPDESSSVKTFQNDDIFSDKSSDKSASSKTFQSNSIESTHIQSDRVEGNGGLGVPISNEESSVPPILPPQPASTECVSSIKSQAAEIPNIQDSENSATNVPPEMPPTFSPMLNPMFPAINPMLGLGLDPISMRQMLMLSNPFFASQLLAMEQYYRSLGMPVDMFSFPQTVPNMSFPGLMGAPVGLNIFPNVANFVAPTSQDPKLQSQSKDQNVPQPVNLKNDSCEKPSSKLQTPFEEKGDGNHIPKSFHNEEEENSWYSSLLSNDNAAVIPPPKPPSSLNTNPSSSSFTSDMTNLSASGFNSSETNQSISGSSSLGSSHSKGQTPLSSVETCKSKTDGWGDFKADTSEQSKAKTRTWDDDGWGEDNLPAMSVKNPSVYEEKKKVVHRQPARQPQLSRFQSNRKYN